MAMKKILTLFVFLFVLVVAQSCFTQHYLITDIQFSLATADLNRKKLKFADYTCSSTLNLNKERFLFVISYNKELVSQIINQNLGSACYATTVGEVIDNPLVEDSFTLAFNKSFLYKGQTIVKNTDLFSLKEIENEINIYSEQYYRFCDMSGDLILDFSADFNKNTVFEKGEYEVIFSCKTSDNKSFVKNITLTFE